MKKKSHFILRVLVLGLLFFFVSNDHSFGHNEFVLTELLQTEKKEEIEGNIQNGSSSVLGIFQEDKNISNAIGFCYSLIITPIQFQFSVFHTYLYGSEIIISSIPRYILFGSLIVYY